MPQFYRSRQSWIAPVADWKRNVAGDSEEKEKPRGF